MWVLNYNNYPNSIVKESRRGRTKEKYTIDTEYYKDMSRSYFTLCPTECNYVFIYSNIRK